MLKHLPLIGGALAITLMGSCVAAEGTCTEETRNKLRNMMDTLIDEGLVEEQAADSVSKNIITEMGLSFTEAPSIDVQCEFFQKVFIQLGQEDVLAELLGE